MTCGDDGATAAPLWPMSASARRGVASLCSSLVFRVHVCRCRCPWQMHPDTDELLFALEGFRHHRAARRRWSERVPGDHRARRHRAPVLPVLARRRLGNRTTEYARSSASVEREERCRPQRRNLGRACDGASSMARENCGQTRAELCGVEEAAQLELCDGVAGARPRTWKWGRVSRPTTRRRTSSGRRSCRVARIWRHGRRARAVPSAARHTVPRRHGERRTRHRSRRASRSRGAPPSGRGPRALRSRTASHTSTCSMRSTR